MVKCGLRGLEEFGKKQCLWREFLRRRDMVVTTTGKAEGDSAFATVVNVTVRMMHCSQCRNCMAQQQQSVPVLHFPRVSVGLARLSATASPWRVLTSAENIVGQSGRLRRCRLPAL